MQDVLVWVCQVAKDRCVILRGTHIVAAAKSHYLSLSSNGLTMLEVQCGGRVSKPSGSELSFTRMTSPSPIHKAALSWAARLQRKNKPNVLTETLRLQDNCSRTRGDSSSSAAECPKSLACVVCLRQILDLVLICRDQPGVDHVPQGQTERLPASHNQSKTSSLSPCRLLDHRPHSTFLPKLHGALQNGGTFLSQRLM